MPILSRMSRSLRKAFNVKSESSQCSYDKVEKNPDDFLDECCYGKHLSRNRVKKCKKAGELQTAKNKKERDEMIKERYARAIQKRKDDDDDDDDDDDEPVVIQPRGRSRSVIGDENHEMDENTKALIKKLQESANTNIFGENPKRKSYTTNRITAKPIRRSRSKKGGKTRRHKKN